MNHAGLSLPSDPSRDFKYVYPHVLCPSRNNAIRVSRPRRDIASPLGRFAAL